MLAVVGGSREASAGPGSECARGALEGESATADGAAAAAAALVGSMGTAVGGRRLDSGSATGMLSAEADSTAVAAGTCWLREESCEDITPPPSG